MRCLYCGREIWLVFLDRDFCCGAHRKKYHEGVKRALAQLPHSEEPEPEEAGFQAARIPAAARQPAGRARIWDRWQISVLGPLPPSISGLTVVRTSIDRMAQRVSEELEPVAVAADRALERSASARDQAVAPITPHWLQAYPGFAPRPATGLAVGGPFTPGAIPARARRSPELAQGNVIWGSSCSAALPGIRMVGSAPQMPASGARSEQPSSPVEIGESSAALMWESPALPVNGWLTPELPRLSLALSPLAYQPTEPSLAGPIWDLAEAPPRAVRAKTALEPQWWPSSPAAVHRVAMAILAAGGFKGVTAGVAPLVPEPVEGAAPASRGQASFVTAQAPARVHELGCAACLAAREFMLPLVDRVRGRLLPASLRAPVHPVLCGEAILMQGAAARPRFSVVLPASHQVPQADFVEHRPEPAALASRQRSPRALRRAVALELPAASLRTAAATPSLAPAGVLAVGPAPAPPQSRPRSTAPLGPSAAPPRSTKSLESERDEATVLAPFADLRPRPARPRRAPFQPPVEPMLKPPARPLGLVLSVVLLPAMFELPKRVLPLEFGWQSAPSVAARAAHLPARRLEPSTPAFSLRTRPPELENVVQQNWRRRARTSSGAAAPRDRARAARVIALPTLAEIRFNLRQNAALYVRRLAACVMLASVLWVSEPKLGLSRMAATGRVRIEQGIRNRATLELADNFHSGLAQWEGGKDWVPNKAEGYIRTGRLSLYRPSLVLTDYRLEFFGQIESKSIGWVFRATDPQNYYAMKFTILQPGPRPMASIVRYPVIQGQKGQRVQIPLQIMVHNNRPYHVQLDVSGTQFKTSIEGQVVDVWSDDTLRAGGIGFFSEAGERARLYWMKVSNHTDLIGKFCGALALNRPMAPAFEIGTPEDLVNDSAEPEGNAAGASTGRAPQWQPWRGQVGAETREARQRSALQSRSLAPGRQAGGGA